MKFFLTICLVLVYTQQSIQASSSSSPGYIAAVVEYHGVEDATDGQKSAEANANHYKTIMKKAQTLDVDIIVFPEFGLTTPPNLLNATKYRQYYRNVASHVPEPAKNVVPCDDASNKYAKYLKSISCAAKEMKMYVVVNHMEKVDCPPVAANATNNCSADGFLLYNANAVFDRNGRLISKYRKFNLYNEPGTNKTKEPEIATFKTDFNVTFGQLICADLFRQKPAMHYWKNPNVTDVIFTTHWYDKRPFEIAVAKQAGFAYSADVNLLAAGHSNAMTGMTGSGVYAGKSGPIKLYRSKMTSNALIVGEVPKMNRGNRVENILAGKSMVHVFTHDEVPSIPQPIAVPTNGTAYGRENLNAYTTVLLDPNNLSAHIEKVCDRGICCEFHVETKFDKNLAAKSGVSYYRYRLAVFNGVIDVGTKTSAGVEVCSVLACAGETIDDCTNDFPAGTRIVKPMVIQSLVIIARNSVNMENSYYEPQALNNEMVPLNTTNFLFSTSGHRNATTLFLSYNRPIDDLMVCGIYGRKFANDGKPLTSSSTLLAATPVAFLVALFFISQNLIKF